MKKKIISLLVVGFIIFGLTGCGSETNNNNQSMFKTSNEDKEQSDNINTQTKKSYDDEIIETSTTTNNSTKNTTNKKKNPGLGDTFEFDGLEITFDTEYTFVTVDNSYSEYNGQPVIELGATVKNISDEKNHLNMFYYELFGSKGVELDSISSYFDNDIDYAGDLKPGASYKQYFHIIYDGDGTYSIDFDNWDDSISIEFEVKMQ